MSYCKWMEKQSKLIRAILCLPVLDLSWAIYRIVRGLAKKNYVHALLGILWILPGAPLLWLVDLIWVIAFDKIAWFDKD